MAKRERRSTTLHAVPAITPVASTVSRSVLIIIRGPEIGVRYVLDRNEYVLGRDPDVGISLSDRVVSRQHARIYRDAESGELILEDLGSRNGTRVNGKRIKTTTPLKDGDKIFLGRTVIKYILEDMFEGRFFEELERLISIDELTGLMSMRRFEKELQKAVERALKRRERLTLLMMDLDGLKQVNDRHGHLMGAHTIAEVGRLIGRVVADRGDATRFGGDEFMALLPDSSLEQATPVAEDIREQVEQLQVEHKGITISVTISIGLASVGGEIAEPGVLVRAADQALYQAKAAGRNCVRGWLPPAFDDEDTVT